MKNKAGNTQRGNGDTNYNSSTKYQKFIDEIDSKSIKSILATEPNAYHHKKIWYLPI